MKLLHPQRALVQATVDGGCYGQCTSHNGTNAGEETSEGLGTCLPVDDFHGRDVVLEEDAGETTLRVDTFLVAFCGVVAAHKRSFVRCDGVLVRFDAALSAVSEAVLAEWCLVQCGMDCAGEGRIPAQGEVGS